MGNSVGATRGAAAVAAALLTTAHAVPASAEDPPPGVPPVVDATTAPEVLSGPPIVAAFGWHSTQRGGWAGEANIQGSGGNGNRRLMVLFEQNSYRDVGLFGIGSKTLMSSGWTEMEEYSGAASTPDSGKIIDSSTCSGAKITGIEIGVPKAVIIAASLTSVTQELPTAATGGSKKFKRNYNNVFQCRIPSASPAKTTRWSFGEMKWKNGSLSGSTSRDEFWW